MGPVFQKVRQFSLKIQKCRGLSFFLQSLHLSWWFLIYFMLFSASKKQIKKLQYESCYSSWCTNVLNSNIRPFHFYVQLLKLAQFMCHILYIFMYFVLTRRVETAQNYLNCFYFASWNRAFYQHSLHLACWWAGKNWKEKEIWIALTFPFLLCHHSQSKKLLLQRTNRNRKSYDRTPRSFMLLRTTLPFLAFWLGLWIPPAILQSRR